MSYYIASCSCGKDSLALVYRLIKEQAPLNEIVFYDTGMEFDSIYYNWERLREYAEAKGVKCTVLLPQCSFLYMMFEQPHTSRKDGITRCGYSWCGGVCRWGTHEKLIALDKYCEQLNAYCYVGIAADELRRLEKERKAYKLFPLIDWNMTEADCLSYCRKRGIGWIEKCTSRIEQEFFIDLYNYLDRVSCWCCGNKNHWELYNMWRYLPHYWDKLCDLQRRNERPFKKPYSVFDMQARFENGYVPKHRTKKERTP